MATPEKAPQQTQVQRVGSSAKSGSASKRPHARDSRSMANQIARGLLVGIVLLAIGTSLFFRFKTARFVNLVSRNAMDAGQIAFNFRMHKTLTTNVTYPLALSGSHPDRKGYDIGRPPLYPIVLAGFFKTRGISDDTVVMVNALGLFILAWVLYGIVLITFDKSTAAWAVLAYFVSVEVIGMALTADGTVLTALLFSLAVLLALHALKRSRGESAPDDSQPPPSRLASPWPWLVGVGLAGGLAYLAGYFSPLVWIALAVAATVNMGKFRRTATAVVVLAALMLGSMWWVRNTVALGTPWPVLERSELLMGTKQYPADSVLWALSGVPKHPALYLLTHPSEAFTKVATNAVGLYRAIPNLANLYLFPFLIAAFIWLPKTPERRLVLWVFGATLVVQVVTAAFTTAGDAPLALLRPLAVGLAVAALLHWLRGTRIAGGVRVLASVGIILVLSLPYAASAIRGGQVAPSPSVSTMASIRAALQVPAKAVFMSDDPWVVAWYGHYRAELLPSTPADLDKMTQLSRPPYLFYFTAAGPRQIKGREDPWPKFLSDPRQASRLGLPLFLPTRELLVLTPTGIKEAPQVSERIQLIHKRMQEERKRATTSGTPASQPQGG